MMLCMELQLEVDLVKSFKFRGPGSGGSSTGNFALQTAIALYSLATYKPCIPSTVLQPCGPAAGRRVLDGQFNLYLV